MPPNRSPVPHQGRDLRQQLGRTREGLGELRQGAVNWGWAVAKRLEPYSAPIGQVATYLVQFPGGSPGEAMNNVIGEKWEELQAMATAWLGLAADDDPIGRLNAQSFTSEGAERSADLAYSEAYEAACKGGLSQDQAHEFASRAGDRAKNDYETNARYWQGEYFYGATQERNEPEPDVHPEPEPEPAPELDLAAEPDPDLGPSDPPAARPARELDPQPAPQTSTVDGRDEGAARDRPAPAQASIERVEPEPDRGTDGPRNPGTGRDSMPESRDRGGEPDPGPNGRPSNGGRDTGSPDPGRPGPPEPDRGPRSGRDGAGPERDREANGGRDVHRTAGDHGPDRREQSAPDPGRDPGPLDRTGVDQPAARDRGGTAPVDAAPVREPGPGGGDEARSATSDRERPTASTEAEQVLRSQELQLQDRGWDGQDR